MNETIGNYRIVKKLGQGGMGTVYKAVDVMLERPVALKVLRGEFTGQPELAERFRTEAIILARLNHPRIATLYGLVREGGQMMMAMEFVEGETLEKVLERDGRVQAPVAVGWCCQVLEAMAYAHRHDVVHRDIKPANIMVTDEDAIKVMDFGIARVLGTAHQTQYGHVIGTACFMAPEQIRGQEVDGRTDLYALGIVLYQLVTGYTPFRGDDEFSIMTAQISRRPESPATLVPGLPAWLDGAIMRALEKNPDDRFQNANEFRRTLELGLRSSEEEPTVRGPLSAYTVPETPTPPWSAALPPEVAPSGSGSAPVARAPALPKPSGWPESPEPRAAVPQPPPARLGGGPVTAPAGPMTPGPYTPPTGYGPYTPPPGQVAASGPASAAPSGATPPPVVETALASAPIFVSAPAAAAASGAEVPWGSRPQPARSSPLPSTLSSAADVAETRLVEPHVPPKPAVPLPPEPVTRAVPAAARPSEPARVYAAVGGAALLLVAVGVIAWLFLSRPSVPDSASGTAGATASPSAAGSGAAGTTETPSAAPDSRTAAVSPTDVPGQDPSRSLPPSRTSPAETRPAQYRDTGSPEPNAPSSGAATPTSRSVPPSVPASGQPSASPTSPPSPAPATPPVGQPAGAASETKPSGTEPKPAAGAAESKAAAGAAESKAAADTAESKAAADEEADAASGGEPEVFEEIELVRGNGTVEVNLNLHRGRLTLTSADDDSVVKTMTYASMTSAAYSENNPLTQKKSGSNFVGRLFGGGKHFVTFRSGNDVIVLRLGRGYKDVVAVFEKLSHKKVAMPASQAK